MIIGFDNLRRTLNQRQSEHVFYWLAGGHEMGRLSILAGLALFLAGLRHGLEVFGGEGVSCSYSIVDLGDFPLVC